MGLEGQSGAAPTAAPQLLGDCSTPHCSHRREKRQRRKGEARAQPSTPPAQPSRVPASPRGFPKALQSWQACGDSLKPGKEHRSCFPTVSNTGSAHSTPRCHRPRGLIRTTRGRELTQAAPLFAQPPAAPQTQPAAHAGAQQLSKVFRSVKPLPTPVALLPKASLGYRHVSATVALPQRSPAMQGGCFPSALEGAHSAFHHLVTATLSSIFINKKSSCTTPAHVVSGRRRNLSIPSPAQHLGKNAAHHTPEPKQAFGGSQT